MIAGEILCASLTLSARTRYRLVVNGEIVNSGPCRSNPENREADTYDLKSRLIPGRNLIEVEVLHIAGSTYHNLAEPAGFIAWGHIEETPDQRHALATPGFWLGRQRVGLETEAPLLSFAQEPVEVLDLRPDASAQPTDWVTPEPVGAGACAKLRARTIPPLSRLSLMADTIRWASVRQSEERVSAWVTGSAVGDVTRETRREMAAACGWLYSPCEQTIPLTMWWGSYWINGTKLNKDDDPEVPLRQNGEAFLRTGWNRICAVGEIIFGYWEFCLAWPCDAGLILCAGRDRGTEPSSIELTGPISRVVMEDVLQALVAGAETPSLFWNTKNVEEPCFSPLRALAWAVPDVPTAMPSLPATLACESPMLITADMGQMVLGSIALEIEATAGTVLCLGHAEQGDVNGRPVYDKAVTMYSADRFILPGGRVRLETFFPRGFRYLEVRVSAHTGPVTLHAIGAVETRYPYRFGGTFKCSDPDLNRLWKYGQRTLELCSEDVLTDCPWRERTLYGGDLLAEMGATAALTGDMRLVRRSLDVLLASFDPQCGWLASRAPTCFQMDLSDYPLLVAIGVGWLLRLTDDQPFAERAWPVFREMAHTLARMCGPDGIYTPTERAFIDHGRHIVGGPTVAFNAVCVGALRAFALTARQAGDASAAPELEARAKSLEALLPATYLDTTVGLFRDLPMSRGGNETEGSPAVVWPLLFAPGTRRHAPEVMPALRRILDGFDPKNEARSVSPYQMFYLLALLRELGEAELSEQTIRRVYACMLVAPTGTLWENAMPDKSLTHAWSAGVNYYLATAVLGVGLGFDNPEEMRSVQVRPCAASLSWARGRVAHPLGDVAVDWRVEGGCLRVVVEAPLGVPVAIKPRGPLAALSCVSEIIRTGSGVRELVMA